MNMQSFKKGTAICFVLSALIPKASADVLIAKSGKAAAKVVVDGAADPTEKQAADELAFFLHIVTGGSFPVVQEDSGNGSRLLVGPGAAKRADPKFAAAGLEKEEIIVRTAGNDLILAGEAREPRSTRCTLFSRTSSAAAGGHRRPAICLGSAP